MTIPDYQALMLPLLRIAEDGKEHGVDDAINELAVLFKLSSEERKELLPSGRQPKFDNRVGWARTYLKKAGLLETPGRGRFRITERGLKIVRQNPARIDVKFLEQFPEFVEFRTRRVIEIAGGDNGGTPEEVLESTYQGLRRQLAQDLLERVKQSSPKFFERLVVDLLLGMGYGGSRKDAGQAIGQTGDGGVDGIINQDRLGLDVVYIQAKRWDRTVGEPTVRDFAGSLEGKKAKRGVLITTGQFSAEAKRFADRIEKRIVLIDGEHLAQLMIDHSVGVAEQTSYSIKKIDEDFFEGEQ